VIVEDHDSVGDDDSPVDDKGAIGVVPLVGSVDELGVESLGDLNRPKLEGVQSLGESGGNCFGRDTRKGVEDTELAGLSGLNAGEPTRVGLCELGISGEDEIEGALAEVEVAATRELEGCEVVGSDGVGEFNGEWGRTGWRRSPNQRAP